MCTERLILSYNRSIEVFILRPATVCGFSPRMRLDVAVNALTFSALKDKTIKVFGGSQIRPNVHIDDMVDAYIFFLKSSKQVIQCLRSCIYNGMRVWHSQGRLTCSLVLITELYIIITYKCVYKNL